MTENNEYESIRIKIKPVEPPKKTKLIKDIEKKIAEKRKESGI